MKNSSSRERTATQTNALKYSKPPNSKPVTPLENANLNVAVVGKKNILQKPLPPKPLPKTEYNVEGNMTESKIFQAKKGLQLLKRKMNRTGMSRQKNYSHTDKSQENQPTFNRANSNQQLNSQKNAFQKKETMLKTQISKYSTAKISNKQEKTQSNLNVKQYSQKPIQRDYQDERPIAKSNNFMDLLQKEMSKQNTMNKGKNVSFGQTAQNKNRIFDQNGTEIILECCSKGCGRMFNPQTIEKHEKICQKVFQSKRKAFNSAQHRQPEAEGFHPPPISNNKVDAKPKNKKNEIPKWKLESAAFRAGIKLGKNKPLTKEEEALMQMTQENRICCQYCGRKFSEEAAKKHVPFCQKKSKEISKNNNAKMRK